MGKQFQMTRLDAGESIFFERELEHVKARVYEVDYPEIKHRKLIPVSTEAPPWVDSITYTQYDKVGLFKIIANYADDLPRVDVKGQQFTAVVRSLGGSYGYNVQEIRASRALGKPLDIRRANTAREAHLRSEQKRAWEGDAAYNLQGFLSNPNTSEVTIPNDGTGTSKLWSTKTADQMIRDLNLVANKPFEATFGIETTDTMLLPPGKYSFASTFKVGQDANMTVLRWFLTNHPTCKNADWINELTGYGAGSTDRMLAYRRDPSKLTQEVPQDFEQFPPEARNLEYTIACHARYGGVLIYKPLSIAWGDGI
jgi:hypothetical protein